jgi:hypothetical protein
MITETLETGDMMVVTVMVPTRSASDLSVKAAGRVVTVSGPDGFRHEVEMLPSADVSRLGAYLFHDILELRAPQGEHGVAPGLSRAIPVRAIG